MSTKHFFDDADKLVRDCLESLTYTNPSLQYLTSEKSIIYAGRDSESHVSLLSGGGAGHEPSHAAYVGRNMLTAAVSGSIFASPSVSQIFNTVRTIGGKAGTLLIVKNYTGDVLNFSLAASKASAAGTPTTFVVVADDVSVGRAKSGKVGRRGLAGTVLVHKIVGSFAAHPEADLDSVRNLAQNVADNLVTVGASLNRVHVPGRSADAADFLSQDELELGMGIHNEPGCRRISPLPSLSTLVEEMLKQLIDPNDKDRAYVNFEDGSEDVVLMVNNLGGTSVLELGGVANEVLKQLDSSYKIAPARIYVGTYMTSLDGPGFSITLLKATDEMLNHLDTDVGAVGWSPANLSSIRKAEKRVPKNERVIAESEKAEEKIPESNITVDVKTLQKAVQSGCERVIAAEPKLTEYDTQVGDGDCGTTLKRGAKAVSSYVTSLTGSTADAVLIVHAIANLTEQNMDGTSGAIFSIYLNSLVTALRSSSSSSTGSTPATTSTFAKAAAVALHALGEVTPARPGDRTLMDALTPFVEVLGKDGDVSKAAQAARKGADGTKGMTAKLGRSVYVDEKNYGKVPDPGAVGLAEFFEGLAEGL